MSGSNLITFYQCLYSIERLLEILSILDARHIFSNLSKGLSKG